MLKRFIERPVLSGVISIMVFLLGILGLYILPVSQYPEIAPPTVQVRTVYTGANAQTVLESVIVPLEEQINGVEDMDYITSTAANDGSASIQVVFKQGVNPDIATVNVQNRVARAAPILPAEVTRSGVTTQKQQTSALMFLSFYSESNKYDAGYIQNYLNINVVPVVKRVNGVGDAMAFGSRWYSMRVWLKPDRMAAYGLSPIDVNQAINEQSLEAAAGQLGENDGASFQYILKYGGKYRTEEQYENIVVKALPNGQSLYLKDIADIELGSWSYAGNSELNGKPAVTLAIYQTPGSNAREISKNLKVVLEDLATQFPPGMSYTINFDTTEFLDASIHTLVRTFIEAFILVFIVVFLFLQDFRSTLIPLLAVPVSIIGTFFFLTLFGFTLNLLTLFALVLAIGIVVDDAIVVVEAIHAKLEQTEMNPRESSVSAMGEISGAIVSITLVLAAVFIPVTFISGPTGVFYRQFGVTLIVAIIISAVNALTLSPALSALFLRQHDDSLKKKGFSARFFKAFNTAFEAMTHKYSKSFKFLFNHKWVTGLVLALCVGLIFLVSKNMSSGFVPNEDRGFLFGTVELPPGATQDRVYHLMKEFEQTAMKQINGIDNIAINTGQNFINGSGSNYGMFLIKLKGFEERKTPALGIESITGQLFGLAGNRFKDAKMLFFQPPTIPGFGANSGFELKLMDKQGGSLKDFESVAQSYLAELNQRPEIAYAQTSFNNNYAQYEIKLDVERAKQSGVTVRDLLATLQGYIGGIYAADFIRFGKQFRVVIQTAPENRRDEASLNNIYVKTAGGKMAPISQFVKLERVYGPQSVTRFNLFTSVNVTGAPATGYSSGDAIQAINEVAQKSLSSQFGVDFSGLTREEIKAGSQTIFIFLLSVIFTYFILSAQYESFLLPLSVILSLPGGVMGAFLSQKVAGLENNIFFQIALIMLVGLLAKNAILIVEFALQRRRHGESIWQAAVDGAIARLRPILMTSFAFIIGLMPLVLASGVGKIGNRSVATGAAFGLLIGTIIGVFIIPVLFVVFQTLQEKIKPVVFDKPEEKS